MRTFVFIPVRLASTRLPSKALLKIENKPCLQYLVERIKEIKEIEGIVICTTKNEDDDLLEKFAKRMNIHVFRGSELDILERFRDAAVQFNVENIVNVDGDDIFCELDFIKSTIKELNEGNVDFVSWKNLPLGTTPIGIKFTSLIKICNQKTSKNTETGWGKFFTDSKFCKIKNLSEKKLECSEMDLRLTLDYPEDFKLFEQIIINVDYPYRLKDIIEFLKKRKDIFKINERVKKKYWENFKVKSTDYESKD